MSNPIQMKRDTAANWTSANPTILVGTPAFETDTGKYKIGDGTTAWNSLAYKDPAAALAAAAAAQATANAAIPTTQKGATSGVAPNSDTIQITSSVVISVANANAATYNGKVLEFTGAFSVTLGAGLPGNFGFGYIPPATGNASFISDGTTLLNGATTTLTRSAAQVVMGAVTQRNTNQNSYVVI
jgi:hypothetical protein